MDYMKLNRNQIDLMGQLTALRRSKLRLLFEINDRKAKLQSIARQLDGDADISPLDIMTMDSTSTEVTAAVIGRCKVRMELQEGIAAAEKSLRHMNSEMYQLLRDLGEEAPYAMHPGEMLNEKIEEDPVLKTTLEQSAIGVNRLERLRLCTEDVDDDLAKLLQDATGIPAHVWLATQMKYNETYEEKEQ